MYEFIIARYFNYSDKCKEILWEKVDVDRYKNNGMNYINIFRNVHILTSTYKLSYLRTDKSQILVFPNYLSVF